MVDCGFAAGTYTAESNPQSEIRNPQLGREVY